MGDPLYDPAYDVDNDGDIDIIDVQLVASWWNKDITGNDTPRIVTIDLGK